jgi:RNA polymerase sigma factor for flagellar operon FliA
MSDRIRAPEPSDSELEGFWERFKQNGDQRAREGLILHYSPLVKFVAGRLGVGLPRSA